MPLISERAYSILSGLLLIAGTALFLWGGIQHPAIGARLGTGEQFFRNFAAEILRHSNWVPIHWAILIGPVLWALGAVGVNDFLRRAGESRWSALGLASLLMGAACWAVTFVFDGMAAPVYANAIALAPSEGVQSLLVEFAANQAVVIRLGLVSWILIGLAAAAFAVSLATTGLRGRWFRWALVGSGIVLGMWPLAAWWGGTFSPGPFTSPWWKWTALATSVWYAAAGVLLVPRSSRGAD
jgi:hypothetical protein